MISFKIINVSRPYVLCNLSPLLFNIYGDYIIRNALKGWKGDVITYATPDSTLRAIDEQEVSELNERVESAKNKKASIEIKRRIALSKTKRRLVEALELPIALYGNEAWLLKTSDIPKQDIFEKWDWRQFLRISRTAHRTYTSILEELTD